MITDECRELRDVVQQNDYGDTHQLCDVLLKILDMLERLEQKIDNNYHMLRNR